MSTSHPPFSGVLSETSLAIEAILQAGIKVMEIYNTAFRVLEKDDQSPITLADVASNGTIEEILSRSQIPILSEEGENQIKSDTPSTWIIDPLDGTKEFVSKNGEFTIMIALVDNFNHNPLIGVIYSPVDDSLYVAQKDKGAYRRINGKWERLNVSSTSRIEDARAVLSRSHIAKEELDFVKYLNVRSSSRLGSSLKILSLCSGAAEIYFTATSFIKQWDTCASYCLITESGGKMTDLYGNDLQYNKQPLNHEKGIIATNGLLHSQVIEKGQVLRNKLFRGQSQDN